MNSIDEQDKHEILKDCIEKNSWNWRVGNMSIETSNYLLSLKPQKKHLFLEEGEVYFKNRRLVPKENQREEILKRGHECHQGVYKARKRIEQYYWWPQLIEQVLNLVKNCELCRNSERTAKTFEVPLVPIELPSQNFDLVSLDITGPIKGFEERYLIVLMD